MTTISEQPSTGAGHVLVHMVGAADLGTRPGPEFTKKLDELVAADPSEAARLLTPSADLSGNPVPLVAVFADGAPRYDRVILVVTSPRAGEISPSGHTFRLGEAIKKGLEGDGLYGVGFPPESVELLKAGGPDIAGVRTVIGKRLSKIRGTGAAPRVDIPYGGGAANAAIGLVVGVIESGVEPRLLLLAGTGGKPIVLSHELPTPTENADRWLVRHRFYSSMIKGDRDDSDQDGNELWRSRLNRQILVAETTDDFGEEDLARVLLERIDRREAVDGFLFRAWLKEARTRSLADRDKPAAALDFLRHPQLSGAEEAAKDLSHGKPTDPMIIRRFLEGQDQLPRFDEGIADLGYPKWPYLGDRRALILVAMGMDPIEGDDPATPRLDALIARAYRDGFEPVIRMLVSKETAPVGRLWEAKARARTEKVDCRVLLECGIEFDDLDDIRSDVWGALKADDQELDTVGEVRVAAGSGRKPQGLGLLLTGIKWGLYASCPTRLLEIRRAAPSSDESIVEVDQNAVLSRIAGDSELARVALSALECLDVSAAATLLDRGSSRLRPLATRVRRLSLVSVDGGEGRRRTPTTRVAAGVDPEWLASIGIPDQENSALLLLRARLRLIQTLAGSDRWGCAMRAVALCEGTLGKHGDKGWYAFCDRKKPRYIPQANDLACYRNASPASHGREKALRKQGRDKGKVPKPPSPKKLRECLRGLREGLSKHVMVNGQGLPDTWDSVLVDELESLKKELRAFIAPG
ncbi:hypothetical protein [Frankia sp. CiP3]|uniref:hypothetical protein n=1 Tax=Frankia sp. CiP3 TaxID=2880971 RepID=UPI001EF3F135|nr:hypothetical protein [Frankia sp. CiP3]